MEKVEHQPMPVVAMVDNTNPDNAMQVLMLANKEHFDLKGVVVTGRAAADSREAALDEISEDASRYRTRLNTVRMANFLVRARYGSIPVFEGTPAPRTIVPHKVHVDEHDFNDLFPGQAEALRDGVPPQELGLAGSLVDARNHFAKTEGEFAMIIGGPMTDTANLLEDSVINQKTTDIFTQFGMCGFGERNLMSFSDDPSEIPRGKRQFNVACDPDAAHEVLMHFERPVHLYPSDVTRVDVIGFDEDGALAQFMPHNPGTDALADLYHVAYREMLKPRGEKIYVHDAAPAIGAVAWKAAGGEAFRVVTGPYTERRVNIRHVPHPGSGRDTADQYGEIWFTQAEPDELLLPSDLPRRIATEVNAEEYLRMMHTMLDAA